MNQVNNKDTFGTVRETINNNFDEVSTSITSLQDALDSHVVFGVYTGTGDTSQKIELGFTPRAVCTVPSDGVASSVYQHRVDGGTALYLDGISYPCTTAAGKVVEITNNGFYVYEIRRKTYVSDDINYNFANTSGRKYYYKAYK